MPPASARPAASLPCAHTNTIGPAASPPTLRRLPRQDPARITVTGTSLLTSFPIRAGSRPRYPVTTAVGEGRPRCRGRQPDQRHRTPAPTRTALARPQARRSSAKFMGDSIMFHLPLRASRCLHPASAKNLSNGGDTRQVPFGIGAAALAAFAVRVRVSPVTDGGADFRKANPINQ
jgi:hypothetical protein